MGNCMVSVSSLDFAVIAVVFSGADPGGGGGGGVSLGGQGPQTLERGKKRCARTCEFF